MDNRIYLEIEEYISTNKIKTNRFSKRIAPKLADLNSETPEEFLNAYRSESFKQVLFRFIDRTTQKDSDVYKKAFIDRRLFSKIRSGKDYIPSKKTVIALCLALCLNRDDTNELLQSAGYSLSRANDFDLIIAFCIEKEIFNFFDINDILDRFDYETF